jgi:hypothetical protein
MDTQDASTGTSMSAFLKQSQIIGVNQYHSVALSYCLQELQ